jgi:hypothetical protein
MGHLYSQVSFLQMEAGSHMQYENHAPLFRMMGVNFGIAALQPRSCIKHR